MKIPCTLGVYLIALFLVDRANALPPFYDEWKVKYVEGNPNAKFVAAAEAAKCNVCHAPFNKKKRNEYGTALKTYLSRAGYEKVKANPAESKAYINEGLTRAETNLAPDGQTFIQRITAGNLP
jgi:hypothetical protein